jgi:hypothetical protein
MSLFWVDGVGLKGAPLAAAPQTKIPILRPTHRSFKVCDSLAGHSVVP